VVEVRISTTRVTVVTRTSSCHHVLCLLAEQNIEVAIIDMFACGSEPTTSALCWMILVMVAFPDIQQKCHCELDSVSFSHSIIILQAIEDVLN